jgi:hypothetical protein
MKINNMNFNNVMDTISQQQHDEHLQLIAKQWTWIITQWHQQ